MLRTFHRQGFAIPTALLVSLMLVVMLTAGFTLVSTERRVSDNARSQTDAEAIAEGGVEHYLVERTSMGFSGVPAAMESTRVVFAHGYADVVLTPVRPMIGTAPATYLVRGHGVRTTSQVANSRAAERTVAEWVYWKRGSVGTRAAWTSLSGLNKNGGAGTIDGADMCGAAPDAAGVSVPTVPGYVQSGGTSVPAGSPPIDDLGTQAQADSATKIDWDGIVNHGAITPDIAFPGGTWPSFASPTYYPVIMVTGDMTLPTGGRGLLIVTGDVTMTGSEAWDGVILAGNHLISNGNNTVTGAVVTGLNVKLGMPVAPNDIGNGTKVFRYNSCSIASALQAYWRLMPYRNAWVDDWATF
jgi:Tfp pilus assembly protein PilX